MAWPLVQKWSRQFSVQQSETSNMLVGAKTSGNVFWSQITIELRRTFNSCVTITNHMLWVACVQNWWLGENGDVGMKHCLTSLPIYAKLHLKSTLRIFKPVVWLFPITWQFGVHWVLVHIPNIIFYFDFWSRLVKYRNFATFFGSVSLALRGVLSNVVGRQLSEISLIPT